MKGNGHPKIDCEPNCYGCKLNSVQIGVATSATTRQFIKENKEFQKERELNVPAYKRLRKEGFRPKATKGAAKLEATAVSEFEIESGIDLKGDVKAGIRADEVNAAVKAGQLAEVL